MKPIFGRGRPRLQRPLRVMLRRPGHADEPWTTYWVHDIDSKIAVASLHSEGYWVLPSHSVPDDDATAIATWVEAADARFTMTRERR